jgi:mannitol/fructose-specific phosphotransferase system IIA component (Ntr-type)
MSMDDFRDRLARAAASLGFLVTEIPQDFAKTSDAAVRFLVDRLAAAGVFGAEFAESAIGAVLARERLGSTGVGRGLAFPHGNVSFLERLAGIFAHSDAGIAWNSLDGKPVHHICLMLSSVNRPTDAMRALERLNGAL